MDEELEDLLVKNNTDHLNDFKYELYAFDYIRDILAIMFTIIGLISDGIIVLIVARNPRMRSRPNLLIMHVAINDGLFLLNNMHFLSATFELMGAHHLLPFNNCLIGYVDADFQLNVVIFLAILSSSTFMKSKRIVFKWVYIGIYCLSLGNFICTLVMCMKRGFPLVFLACFFIFLYMMVVVVSKDINACYKRWYKKDPLSEPTTFRLNVVRIYVYSWVFTFPMYLLDVNFHYVFYLLGMNCYMTSMYILIYLVYADKYFLICFHNLWYKDASEYDVDATITFAEESNEQNVDKNLVSIDFSSHSNDNII